MNINVQITVHVVYGWPLKESTTSNVIESYIQEQRHILQSHMYSLHPMYQNDGNNPYPAHQSTLLHTIHVFLHFQTTELGRYIQSILYIISIKTPCIDQSFADRLGGISWIHVYLHTYVLPGGVSITQAFQASPK